MTEKAHSADLAYDDNGQAECGQKQSFRVNSQILMFFTLRSQLVKFIVLFLLSAIGFPAYADLGFFVPGVVNHVPTKSEKTIGNKIHSESVCKKQNGQWFSGKGYAYCVLPYPDSGKVCTSSKDCIGHCIAPLTEEPVKSGTCQMDDSTDDCGRPQFENGKVIYFNCD